MLIGKSYTNKDLRIGVRRSTMDGMIGDIGVVESQGKWRTGV